MVGHFAVLCHRASVGVVGCLDATFGQSSSVEEAATGLVPSRPRANRRIDTSSEALGEGVSTRGPRCGGLGETVSGELENHLLPLGLGDGVSGESEILVKTSFVHSVGSVFRV